MVSLRVAALSEADLLLGSNVTENDEKGDAGGIINADACLALKGSPDLVWQNEAVCQALEEANRIAIASSGDGSVIQPIVGDRKHGDKTEPFNQSSLSSGTSSFVTAITSSLVLAEALYGTDGDETLQEVFIKNDSESTDGHSIQPPSSGVSGSAKVTASTSHGSRSVDVANLGPSDSAQHETTMSPTNHIVIDKPFATIARFSPVIQHSDPYLTGGRMPPTVASGGDGSADSTVDEDAPEDEIHGNTSSTTRSIATATSSNFTDLVSPQDQAATSTSSPPAEEPPRTVSSSWSESLALASEVERQVQEVLERYRRGGAGHSADDDDAPEDELRATLAAAAAATSVPRISH
jgi:hypothetical protein